MLRIGHRLRAFRASTRGNVAMTFGLAVLPIMFLIGAGIDYSRVSKAGAKLQAAVDATALLLCKSAVTSTTSLKTTAQQTLTAYMPSPAVAIDALTVTTSPRAVTLTTHIDYPMTMAQLMNVNTFRWGATASCTAGQTNYEIALVLDTTGSMANSAGGVSKLQALQTAATNFVNTMFSSVDSSQLKISLVPFAAAVKVDPITYASATWLDLQGKSKSHWANLKGTPANYGYKSRFDIFKKLSTSYAGWSWAGCLESLPYPLNVQDGAPSSSNLDSYYVPLFGPDEVGNSGGLLGGVLNLGTSNIPNSYMDDGSGLLSSCDLTLSSNSDRMGQVCKYASPRNIQTSQPGPNWMCDSRALTRLTNNKTTLLNEISQLKASGNTDIHEGLMWGWRTISPLSVFADGAAYSGTATRTVKIIVLMTDGTNTWTATSANPVTGSYYSAYGYFTNADGTNPNARLPPANANPTTSDKARAAMDALTAESCTNAKTAGITIYSVGFSVSSDPIDAAGQTLLSNCASQSANYFLASDSTALNNAFNSIAQGIGQLRLTH